MAAVNLTSARLSKNGKRLGRPPGRVKLTMTADLVRELLCYDPDTGSMTNKSTRSCRAIVGEQIGTVMKKGHLSAGVAGGRYLVHRLAWLHFYGQWPSQQIDHINGDPSDNRIANLRDVSNVTNQQNKHRPPSNNTTGTAGVSRNYDAYCAYIDVDGKRINLGRFRTIEEAAKARFAAKRLLHAGYVGS